MNDRRTARGSRWRKIALRVGAVCVGVYVLYVVAVLVFLNAGGMAWATRHEKDVQLVFAGGYSFWPNRVHIEGFELSFKDYNVEMEIRADSVDAHVSLWQLLRKRVHVSWLRAQGAEYRLVHRVHDPVANAPRLQAFPEIAAFDRPLYYDEPPGPPGGDDQWIVRFDSVEAEARLAWVLEYRMVGPMQVRGGFELNPMERAHVFPCELDVQGARVFVGQERIAHDVVGRLTTEVGPFDPRDSPFEKVLPTWSGRLSDFSAQVDSLSLVRLYADTSPGVIDGRGRLTVQMGLERGRLLSEGRARLELAPWQWRVDRALSTGTGSVELLTESEGRFELIVDARADEAASTADKALLFDKLTGRLGLRHRDLNQVEIERGALDFERLRWRSPEAFAAWVDPSSLVPVSGEVTGRVDGDESQARLTSRVEARQLNFYWSGTRVGVNGELELECRGTSEAARCSADVHTPYVLVDDTATARSSGSAWLRLATRDARVSLTEGSVEARVTVSGSDPKPVVSELIGEQWAAQLGLSLVPTGPLQGSMDLGLRSEGVSLRVPGLSSGSSRVRGSLRAAETTTGAWLLSMPLASFGFSLEPDGVSLHPLVGSDWLPAF